MNIYQRINAIRKELPYIKKDASVTGGGNYKAVTHDNVTAQARPIFIQHGVVIVPRLVSGSFAELDKKTSKGNPFNIYNAIYEIDFVNADDPSDKITAVIGSVAEDLSDKGPGKAVSYATKYAILKVLMIETGESDESRNPDNVQHITEKQAQEITDMLLVAEIEEGSGRRNNFLKFAGAKSVETIPASNYDKVVAQLMKAAEK